MAQKKQRKNPGTENSDNRTMGTTQLLTYGLYQIEGSFNALFARAFRTTEKDLALAFEAMLDGWQLNHSTTRQRVRLRTAYLIDYGNIKPGPTAVYENRIQITSAGSPRHITDYTFQIDKAGLKPGQTFYEWKDGEITRTDAEGNTVSVTEFPSNVAASKQFTLIVEVIRSNPNGDPHRGGKPRQDDDGHGLYGSCAIKRMIRRYGNLLHGQELYMHEGADLAEVASKSKFPTKEAMLDAFWDMRLFGQGMPTFGRNGAGPLNICIGWTIDQGEWFTVTMTCVAKHNGESAESFIEEPELLGAPVVAEAK